MKNVIYLFVVLVWSSCTNVDRKLEESTTLNNQVLQSNYDPEAKLDSLGISLRDIGNPLANYVHAARSGNLTFLAGKGPRQADGENIVGKLGQDLSVEEGYLAAREAGINQLSVLKTELGSLKKVKRIVSVHGMVNATADFTDHSKVINGYSDLMVAVFGNQGKHARAAVGMVSLPGNMAVEVEMVVEVYPE
ncbi:Enamine deaminase RidA, house cleaning of reactive enamine intermediates, YjgF/YER057c/UK114 family [Maribacter sedimenticola]|uniref:Enamine deaminase RidA, house cleaning of reactive enamine intermediates, YjgF/YER057c/UK114 family n=1 Tax=Maribacter sedimenticola TaxID=228956 RepID=A0ABY1SCL3_9FLAO|nr:RidA family protein [Maribacter sedimenticola]SNR26500.1 Enamine deaminase RidA, house cleaning of reactive enamine intermediates, YjgF/YER057c/UK114 family [Maribacter sedimenticola]